MIVFVGKFFRRASIALIELSGRLNVFEKTFNLYKNGFNLNCKFLKVKKWLGYLLKEFNYIGPSKAYETAIRTNWKHQVQPDPSLCGLSSGVVVLLFLSFYRRLLYRKNSDLLFLDSLNYANIAVYISYISAFHRLRNSPLPTRSEP